MSNVLKMLSRGGAVAAETDPNFKQTTLLLHGDGTNGAQNNTFLDSSSNNFTITRNGNTTQGTFSPFSLAAGEWSNFFDGNGDYLSTPSNSALAAGTGDFTIEFWAYVTSTSTEYVFVETRSNLNFNGFVIYKNLSNKIIFRTTSTDRITSGTSLVANQWVHIAVSRSGTSTKLFMNGVQEGSTYTDTENYSNQTQYYGAYPYGTPTSFVVGYMSNIRFVKGTAVYTAAFTPPTAPLTAITNTSLLTCQSNRFVDNSTNAFAITRNGDVRVTPFSPFAPTAAYSAATNGGSGYFDGSGDYISAAYNATAFNFGTGAVTIEAFVYYISVASGGLVVTTDGSGNSSGGILLYLSASGTLRAYGPSVSGTVTTSVTTGQWYHIALTRSSNTWTLWKDGVSQGTFTDSATFDPGATRPFHFGGSPTNSSNSFISNVRIIKGTALYSSTFTPPSAPLTAITNTSLLLNFTNAGIIDNTAKNVLETVGNAQIETSIVKYGTGALEFDGTGDYLKIPSSVELTMGSGDWTVEFWLNLNATGTQVIVDNRTDAFSANKIYIAYVSNSLNYYTANANPAITGGSLATTTWYHIAVSRSSGSTRLFINGAQAGSTYSDSQTYNTSNFGIGAVAIDGTFGLNGYIDDLRITKGIARYTANFTPPAAALPDQ